MENMVILIVIINIINIISLILIHIVDNNIWKKHHLTLRTIIMLVEYIQSYEELKEKYCEEYVKNGGES